MPDLTPNYGFIKPKQNENYNIDIQNENMDITDTELKNLQDEKASQDDLVAHKADDVSQGEIHGLRLNQDKKLEYFNGIEYVEVKGGGYPVNIVKNVSAKEEDTKVELMWEDPDDVVVDGVTIAEWNHTKVMRKVGSYPLHEEDGELVISSGVRNAYKDTPYSDIGLQNDTTYYYAMFPTTTEEIVTISEVSRVSATPTDVDDKTTAAGPKKLLAGDMNAGYFGVVPASELYTGAEISSACGISQGTLQFSDVGWLKFAIDGKIIFKSQKTYRHSISWDHIDGVGAVKGTKQVTKGGNTYKVRLMKGALTDPSLYDASDRGAKGSEWNRLMLPIHIKAKDKSWSFSNYVESTIPYWGIDFTDNDLQTIGSAGDGSAQWCQETPNTDASYRVYRGEGGVTNSGFTKPSFSDVNRGWSPVLEYVE